MSGVNPFMEVHGPLIAPNPSLTDTGVVPPNHDNNMCAYTYNITSLHNMSMNSHIPRKGLLRFRKDCPDSFDIVLAMYGFCNVFIWI